MRRLGVALAVGSGLWLVGGTLAHGAAEPAEPADFGVSSAEAAAAPARVVGERDGAPLYRKELLSPVYEIDRLYGSMQGPMSDYEFTVGEPGEPTELLWLTGYRAVMKEPDGETTMSQEFMCHSNLDLDGVAYGRTFPSQLTVTGGRLFTLAQGQLELDLPEGFGIPLMSDAALRLNTQVLNHNIDDAAIHVRHRVSVEFVRDRDLAKPLEPLIQRSVFGVALVEGPDGHIGVSPDEVDAEMDGPGCLPAADAGGKGHHATVDAFGRKFTAFWVVEPGRQVNHSRVTDQLDLPWDAAVHYIAVHLHPFAESLELRDVTTGESVFKSKTRQADAGIGLADVEYFSSPEGIQLKKDHEYELTSIYNNTTSKATDSMAVMYLYVRPPDLYDFYFRKKPRQAAAPAH